jgi:hypothetical protein
MKLMKVATTKISSGIISLGLIFFLSIVNGAELATVETDSGIYAGSPSPHARRIGRTNTLSLGALP